MKRSIAMLLGAVMLVGALTACGGSSAGSTAASTPAAAATEAAAELPELTGGFEKPILITSAGQSADANIVQTLCTKSDIVAEINATATADDLSGYKTLIIASGGSSKGLGAAGINADQELERVKAVIDAAKAADMKIVAMHIGGGARRGELSDKFLADPFGKADAAIVVSAGDADNVIRGYLHAGNVPTAYVENQIDCVDQLKTLFN